MQKAEAFEIMSSILMLQRWKVKETAIINLIGKGIRFIKIHLLKENFYVSLHSHKKNNGI